MDKYMSYVPLNIVYKGRLTGPWVFLFFFHTFLKY